VVLVAGNSNQYRNQQAARKRCLLMRRFLIGRLDSRWYILWMKKMHWVAFIVAVFGAGCLGKEPVVSSFADCAKYYPVFKSTPARCQTPEGLNFTQPISGADKEKTEPPPAPSPANGTIQGKATVGPNCPVEKAGQPCVTPPEAYTSRELLIFDSEGQTLVTSTHFNDDGTYVIGLPPGDYIADMEHVAIGGSKDLPHNFSITSGSTTVFDLDIDTGMR
jgi:hypothetical protein